MSYPVNLSAGQTQVTPWGIIKHRKPAIDCISQKDFTIQLVSRVSLDDLNKQNLDLIQNIQSVFPKWKRYIEKKIKINRLIILDNITKLSFPLQIVGIVFSPLCLSYQHDVVEAAEWSPLTSLESYLIGRKYAKIEEDDARLLDFLELENDTLRRVERLLCCHLKIS